MVGAGEVITQRLAGVFPKENSAGIPDLCHNGKRILCQDFQMLGGNFVGGFHRLVQILSNQDIPVIVQ